MFDTMKKYIGLAFLEKLIQNFVFLMDSNPDIMFQNHCWPLKHDKLSVFCKKFLIQFFYS